MTRLRVAIETIGCRANQADSAQLAESLDPARVEIVAEAKDADVVVVNTCCVTAQAERDCRKTARRAVGGPRAPKVLLVGCAANAVTGLERELGPDVEVLRFEQGGTSALRDRILDLAPFVQTAPAAGDEPRMLGRTRALLKIQNGCSHACAYCIVPTARGPEESVAPETVLARAKDLVDRGFKEIVLTGVQLGAWGVDLPGRPGLAALLPQLAALVSPGRLRLSSIEPWHFGAHLVEAATAPPRICGHYHLPLQSGDDAVLAAMGRGYTAQQYLDAVADIRRRRPDAAIGTDVLLGLPGEDEASFQATLGLLERFRPSHLHAFSYSPRQGTRAASMPGQPGREEAKRRVRVVRQLGERLLREYVESQLGAEREIVVEDVHGAEARGLSDNFLQVALSEPSLVPGTLVRVRLEQAQADGRVRASLLP